MYKVILFDFFGVFCAPIATNWFKKNIPDYQTKLAGFQALCMQGDLGELPRDDFNKEASKLTGVPIPEIYLQALHRLGVQPSQTIFVDDRKANVDAAEALGIKGIVFTDTPTFIVDFQKIT
jgi:hypothetical protein